jgi:hypothetical protein
MSRNIYRLIYNGRFNNLNGSMCEMREKFTFVALERHFTNRTVPLSHVRVV